DRRGGGVSRSTKAGLQNQGGLWPGAGSPPIERAGDDSLHEGGTGGPPDRGGNELSPEADWAFPVRFPGNWLLPRGWSGGAGRARQGGAEWGSAGVEKSSLSLVPRAWPVYAPRPPADPLAHGVSWFLTPLRFTCLAPYC